MIQRLLIRKEPQSKIPKPNFRLCRQLNMQCSIDLSRNEVLHEIVSTLLDRLEKDGYVHTVEGEDGDMELVPISEIIEKSKKNA